MAKMYIHIILSCFQSVTIQDPRMCVGFSVNGSSYVAITHGTLPDSPAVNLSLFSVQQDLNLTLVKPVTFWT